MMGPLVFLHFKLEMPKILDHTACLQDRAGRCGHDHAGLVRRAVYQ